MISLEPIAMIFCMLWAAAACHGNPHNVARSIACKSNAQRFGIAPMHFENSAGHTLRFPDVQIEVDIDDHNRTNTRSVMAIEAKWSRSSSRHSSLATYSLGTPILRKLSLKL